MIRLYLIVSAVVALLTVQPLAANAQDKSKTKSKRAPCADRIENPNTLGSGDQTCPVTKLPAPRSSTGLIGNKGSGVTSGSQFGGNTTGGILRPKDKVDPLQKGTLSPKSTNTYK
jgi:hypothetical protein